MKIYCQTLLLYSIRCYFTTKISHLSKKIAKFTALHCMVIVAKVALEQSMLRLGQSNFDLYIFPFLAPTHVHWHFIININALYYCNNEKLLKWSHSPTWAAFVKNEKQWIYATIIKFCLWHLVYTTIHVYWRSSLAFQTRYSSVNKFLWFSFNTPLPCKKSTFGKIIPKLIPCLHYMHIVIQTMHSTVCKMLMQFQCKHYQNYGLRLQWWDYLVLVCQHGLEFLLAMTSQLLCWHSLYM